ncbi:hypothetical protein AGMMS49579_06440 [Spirochaetia bacterium]|nr:hypothetical protein AGMMS49579_06440 [Spirochaetia bacterium]
MKRKLIGKGILAIVLVFGFIVIGCSTGGGTDTPKGEEQVTKFEGTWQNGGGSNYTFTGYTVAFSPASGTGAWTGTFEFTDTTITFKPVDGTSWTQEYTLSESTLTLVQVTGHYYGTFQKQ